MPNTIDLIAPSTIENVDFALYEWFDSELNLFCDTNSGAKKVPILWVSPERSFQIKNNKEFRDINGAINPPIITIERTNISKDQKENGVYFANLPPVYNRHVIGARINQKKTSEFANADLKKSKTAVNFLTSKKKNNKVVYQFKEMILPVYASFTYNIEIMTQYQQQMNQIIQPFITKTGSTRYFLIEKDGYKYECFIDGQIGSKNNLANMGTEERKYISTLTIKVLSNIISEGDNDPKNIIKIYENPVELKLNKDKIQMTPRETRLPNRTAPPVIYTGNSINTARPTVDNRQYILRVTPENTVAGTTTLEHGLNNIVISVDIYEYENNEVVAYINSVEDLRLFPNYIEIDGLENSIQYLFIITG
jgi:hypothetical protein